ncbi:MAG TPA: penicillin-binding protein 1A [Deltaproteobacteria bacterium]|nr:penicillin-binding protein 1A [Deltaproteobacteria bacterium]
MRLIGYVAIAIFTTMLIVGVGFYFYFTRDLPSVSVLSEYKPNLITRVYSRDGEVIGEFYIERRIVVPLQRMPEHLVNAFIAAEDAKFFEHKGIDYLGILRALYKNLKSGRIVQGGSTITQQVARSFFLSPEKTLSRKIREAILAHRIESRLTKEEILYLYLNQIYLGNGAYGVQAASEIYFGKDVSELTIAEAALLAGLPKAPSRYSPYTNPSLARMRQEFVIKRMLEEGFINRKQAEEALREKLILKPRRPRNLWVGPYFTEYVRRYVEEKYGDSMLYKGGLNIYTTLDVRLQKIANRAVDYGRRAYDKRRGFRGAEKVLLTREEIAPFLKKVEERIKKYPIEPGRIYKALVLGVDRKSRSVIVAIGTSHRGIIRYQDLKWARLYNPTNDPDGGELVTNPLHLFHPGDVIEVRIKALPEEDYMLIPCALEQEPLIEAALLVMDPQTGYVLAMVGGSDFSKTQFNRAIQSRRQPGSAFKPIIYAAALDRGFTPATVVVDSPLVFEEVKEEGKGLDWKPRNFEERFHGPTTIREALAKSRNVVTVKVLKSIGVDYVVSYARRLGIESALSRDLSIALGSSGVSLLELVRAYSTFANLGKRPEPLFITRIEDRYGNVLEEHAPHAEDAISPQTAYIITNLLQGVVERGTGWRARALKRPVAGKTGTTNNLNDAWFIGYVPHLVAGVWVGYDDERPLGRNETGSRAAAPIWVRFMKEALKDVPPENFPIPDGVEFVKIDPKTGLLATPSTKDPVFEVFKVGTAPKKFSSSEDVPADEDFFLIDTEEEKPHRQEGEEPLTSPELF